MTDAFNVQEVIREGAKDVPLEALAKKGFKRVKVLDRNTINRLIEEAVEKVITERVRESNDRDQSVLKEKAKAHFQKLLQKNKQEENRHLSEYREQVTGLEQQAATLREELAQKEAEIARMQQETASAPPAASGGGTGDLLALKESIESLAKKVSSGFAAGTGGYEVEDTSDRAIEALIARAGAATADVESNIHEVDVKKAKASSINKNLQKLKAMQKNEGGEK